MVKQHFLKQRLQISVTTLITCILSLQLEKVYLQLNVVTSRKFLKLLHTASLSRSEILNYQILYVIMLEVINSAKEQSNEFKNYNIRKKLAEVWMVLGDVDNKQVS